MKNHWFIYFAQLYLIWKRNRLKPQILRKTYHTSIHNKSYGRAPRYRRSGKTTQENNKKQHLRLTSPFGRINFTINNNHCGLKRMKNRKNRTPPRKTATDSRAFPTNIPRRGITRSRRQINFYRKVFPFSSHSFPSLWHTCAFLLYI